MSWLLPRFQSSFSALLILKHRLREFPSLEITNCFDLWCQPGWGVHNMLRVRVCVAHVGGFLGKNSPNQGLFFGRFSLNMGGLSRN